MASSQCAESNEFVSPTDASALAPGDSLNITFPIYEGFLVNGDHPSTVEPEIRVLASLVADSGEQLETIFDTTFNTTTHAAIEGTGTTEKASWVQLDNGCANHTSALQFIWRVPSTILDSRSAGSFHVSILPDWIGTAISSEPFTILSNSALSADAATTTTIAGSAATPPHHDARRSTIFGTSSDDDVGSTLPGQSDTTSLRGGLLGVAIIVPLLVVIILGTCGTCCWLRRRRGDRSNTGERFRFKKSTFSSTQGSTLLSNASRNDERGGGAAANDRRDRAMSLELARFDSPRPQAAHTRHRPR